MLYFVTLVAWFRLGLGLISKGGKGRWGGGVFLAWVGRGRGRGGECAWFRKNYQPKKRTLVPGRMVCKSLRKIRVVEGGPLVVMVRKVPDAKQSRQREIIIPGAWQDISARDSY